MAERAALRQAPLVAATAGLRLLPPSARFVLRGNERVISVAGATIGVEVEQSPCRASQSRTRAVLWLGPDEYLILAPAAEGRALALTLDAGLRSEPHSLVDVSHRQSGLEISGTRVADILNSGCPLDLDLSAFALGMCTRTVFGKAEIVLWRTAADVFRLEVWRSFTAYVARFLSDVAREY